MTRDTEKCPLSVLTGVGIKRVNFRENIRAFRRDKRNCPYKAGVLIKRVSVERGSTVYFSLAKFQLVIWNLSLAMTSDSQTAKTVLSHLKQFVYFAPYFRRKDRKVNL